MNQLLGEYSIEFVNEHVGIKDFEVDGYRVKMESIRYYCFNRSHVCHYCGLEGEFYFLERNHTDPSIEKDRAHFNLYAIGEDKKGYERWILFTKDHIVPRSKGGKDGLINLVTACMDCNGAKGDSSYRNFMNRSYVNGKWVKAKRVKSMPSTSAQAKKAKKCGTKKFNHKAELNRKACRGKIDLDDI